MTEKRPPFQPGSVYHVYNHGNAGDNIFRQEENYYYFLKRYAEYLYPVASTYAFCLMPNHFHFMVRIKGKKELMIIFKSMGKKSNKLTGLFDFSGLISRQFSNFLNAYTKSFNLRYNRKGKLFLKSLNRKPVEDDEYFKRLIYYIHYNPVLHRYVKKPEEWPYSSYGIFLSRKESKLEKKEALKWFGGVKAFRNYHRNQMVLDEYEFF